MNKLSKEKLLKLIDNSTLKCDPNDEKRELYNKYFAQISDLVFMLPKDFEFENIICLEEIASEWKFEKFIRCNEPEKIKIKFEKLITEIKGQLKARASEITLQYICKIDERISIVSKILSVIFVLVFIVMLVILILELMNIIEDTNKIYNILSILDFGVGIYAFIIERISDSKKGKLQNQSKNAIKTNTEDKFIRHYSSIDNSNHKTFFQIVFFNVAIFNKIDSYDK